MSLKTVVFGAAVAVVAGGGIAAADYPERPITFQVPFGAGGGTDVAARTYAPYLEKCIGDDATLVIINKPGASGQLGFAELAKSQPDGYMISTLNAPNFEIGAITGTAYKLDQFELLGNIVGTNVTLVVSKDSPIMNLADLIKFAKESPNPVNIGTSSLGAEDHLTGLRFAKMADIKLATLPLESAGNVRNAVMGGHIQVGSLSNNETAPFMDQLRVLATATPERLPEMPDVPTFREQGFDLVAGSNHVLGTRAGTPKEIVDKLAGCISEVVKDPAFLADAKKRSVSLNFMDADTVKAFIAKEGADLEELWKTEPWTK